MAKRIFNSAESISEQCRAIEGDDALRAEDRASVRGFYDGGQFMDSCDAVAAGFGADMTNFMTGRDAFADVIGQLSSVHTSQTNTFRLGFKRLPEKLDHLKSSWDAILTKNFNAVINESGKLDDVIDSVCSDAVMFGKGAFFYKDKYTWYPEYMDPDDLLIPNGTKKRVDTFYAVRGTINLEQLVMYRNVSKAGRTGWNGKALNKLIKGILNEQNDDEAMRNSIRYMSTSSISDWERRKKANSDSDRLSEYEVDVWHFYQKRYDKPDFPIEYRVVIRNNVDGVEDIELYTSDMEFDNFSQTLIPMHLATNISGEPLWHEIMGLGFLNYEIDIAIEFINNRLLRKLNEMMNTYWKVGDAGDREELAKIMMNDQNIIPEGIDFAEQKVSPRFNEAFMIMQHFSRMSAKKTNGGNLNNGQNDQLEAQFLEAQNQIRGRNSIRLSKAFASLSDLAKEILRRFLNADILPEDEGYADVMAFQTAMFMDGIPEEMISLDNITVSVGRITGDGDPEKQGMAYSHLSGNIDRFDPDKRAEVLHEMTAIALDHGKADQLVSIAVKEEPKGFDVAMNENAAIITTGMQSPVATGDVDQTHIPLHLQAMSNLIVKFSAMKQINDFDDLVFKALGQHVVEHINRLASYGASAKKLAGEFVSQIQLVSADYDRAKAEFFQGQDQPEANPELQLKVRKQQLEEKKEDTKNYKWSVTQAQREAMAERNASTQERHAAANEKKLELEEAKQLRESSEVDL